MSDSNTIPIHALFAEDNVNPNPSVDGASLIADADIIFGVDVMTQHEFLVCGRNLLREIMDSNQYRDCRVIRIGLDQETDELELLIALVRATKGHDDYQDGEDT